MGTCTARQSTFVSPSTGQAALVEQSLGLDPFAAAMYVFRNRRADRIKIFLWGRNGFWLLFKRPEKDRFVWPRQAPVATLTVEQLHWLLDGIDIEAVRRHPQRQYHRAA